MSVPITGKVALILGPRELVLNKGTLDGVWTGMRFAVLDLRATDVTDPDTKQPLGSIRMEKIRVEVVRVEPKLSLARTYETVEGSGLVGISNIGRMLVDAEPQYKTFTGDAATWDESKSTVKRGDTVEQLIEANPHRVVDMVPVYDSPNFSHDLGATKALVLEEVGGTARNKRYYPTQRDYRAGSRVSWEWDTSSIVGQAWYMGSKGQALKAWDRSALFVGRELPDDSTE